ncbi:MAG TPA: bifunctional oligoribonuclease/PAP phosphatase NrnA [Gaiellales bacterium]
MDDTHRRASDPEFARAVAALRSADRVVIATHENPDGDAIGSLVAAAAGLRGLGKEVRTYLEPCSSIPSELRLLDVSRLERQLDPAGLAGWTLLALDCATVRRLGRGHRPVVEAAATVVDVDHHYDNTRFGDVNLIDGAASSTAEILLDVLAALDVELTPEIAQALYVALVTDTGRFQQRTTGPSALRMAARLVDAGVDIQLVYERVFETMPLRKLRLLGVVIGHLVLYERGRVAVSHVSRDDFLRLGAAESDTEGLVDNLRAISGVEVAGLIREPPLGFDGIAPPNRVSLRSRGAIDVSEIARKTGGGGHKQAAGFSHGGDVESIRRFIAAEAAARLPRAGSAA